jgi:DNA (cytosine-5)-methyltransferase 1
MTYGSLFTGAGGADLGFERAGLECRWQVEINPFCREVLRVRFGNIPRWDDVHTFPPKQMESLNVDAIIGGDPCQENANCRQSGETTSPSLGGEFIRVVDLFRPRIVVRENPARVRRDAPWPWHRFRGELEQRGYVVLPFRLRACCVGADYQRDRLFLLAELQSPERQRLEGDVSEVVARAKQRRQDTDPAGPNRWTATPRVLRGPQRFPHRVDRIKAIGNAWCPAVGEWIGRRLMEWDHARNVHQHQEA